MKAFRDIRKRERERESAEAVNCESRAAMKLVAGSYERFLWGWQVRAKKAELDLAFSYPAHVGPVKCIAACGSIVATGGSDDTIGIFDVSAGKDMGSLYLHTGAVTCLDFFVPEASALSRPTHLFSGSEDGTIGVWDTESWTHLKSMKGHKSALNSLTVHPSGKVALSVERDGHLKMWNLLNGRCTYTHKLPSEGTLIKFAPRSGESYALAREELLDIYSVQSGILEHSLAHEKRILCLAQNQVRFLKFLTKTEEENSFCEVGSQLHDWHRKRIPSPPVVLSFICYDVCLGLWRKIRPLGLLSESFIGTHFVSAIWIMFASF